MSFQAPITIRKALENIENKLYFLPAIQRGFVWETAQIEQLFDSVLRGYPHRLAPLLARFTSEQ